MPDPRMPSPWPCAPGCRSCSPTRSWPRPVWLPDPDEDVDEVEQFREFLDTVTPQDFQ